MKIFRTQDSTRDDFLKVVASKFESKVKSCSGLVNTYNIIFLDNIQFHLGILEIIKEEELTP